ncbi:hypothetical protein [Bryobacter aggregatus]|uniref:hypothetical protein n=1 Tax=Bryobacter aggregatus TaxID=360054 RepID=UPI0004E25BBE|nr:hypothetical protein [Bryobacter aggregatus]
MNSTELRAQVAKILDSNSFRGSKRCSDFLRFVVEETCEGREDLLKERSLGVAVFGRAPDYDTNQDPVVRNTAGQVRKRLAQYYYEPGHEGELRIDLPPGSYVPEWRALDAASETPAPPPAKSPRWWIAALFLVSVAGVAIWGWQNKANALDLFWAPLLDQRGPIVVCIGQGHTYKLSGDWDSLFDRGAGFEGRSSVPLGEVTPAFDRYVGLTDARALARLSGLFAHYDRQIEVRGGRSTTLADLRGKPAVLIGAFNNSWTLSLTGELRFYFEEDAPNRLETVRDRQHPDNLAWKVRSDLPSSQVAEDYAIVTRVFNPTTEQAIVVAAGIRGGGTAAAGEFLTNAGYLEQALKNAPQNWQRHNVQFVLTTRLIGGTPGPARVLAAHYW